MTSQVRNTRTASNQIEPSRTEHQSEFNPSSSVLSIMIVAGEASGDKHGIMRTLLDAGKRAGVKAIILVEHDMDLVAEYSSRIVALQAGKVLADRPPAQFFSDPEIIAAVVGKLVGKLVGKFARKA